MLRRGWAPLVAVAMIMVGAGCGTKSVTGSGSEAGGPTASSPAGDPGSSGSSSGASPSGTPADSPAATVDACALLTPDEVAQAIGKAVPGQAATGMETGGQCSWQYAPQNTAYFAITVNVAGPNTAAGDTVPTDETGGLGNPEPVSGLGGGARYLRLTGTVEFPCAERLCSVQVVNLSDSAAGKRSALALAAAVRGRV